MAVTPQWGLALPPNGQTPWGDDYRQAMTTIDARLLSVRGSFYVEDNVAPTVSPGAGAKAVLTGVQAGPPCMFCDVSGNRITYTGTLTKVPTVVATANVQATANHTLQIQIRKNGQLVPGASKKVRLGPAQTIGNVTVASNIPLDTNDFIELWVANLTDGSDVTVTDANLVTRG